MKRKGYIYVTDPVVAEQSINQHQGIFNKIEKSRIYLNLFFNVLKYFLKIEFEQDYNPNHVLPTQRFVYNIESKIKTIS